jgi:hypothetical protein
VLAASAPNDFDDLGDGFVAGKRAKMRRSVGFSDGISPKRSECSDMLIGTAQGGQVTPSGIEALYIYIRFRLIAN